MVRMQSCHGNEFTPLFREADSGGSESNATDSESEEGNTRGTDFIQEGGESEEICQEEDIDGAFADAKDCWKVDAETLKGFYLHSATGQLFSWDQAAGVLYEYLRGSGECRAIWAAGAPHLSSEIWSILPLPPTDPASLVNAGSGGSSGGSVLCILHLSRARAAQRAALASADFCDRLRLGSRALDALLSLPPAGQAYVLRTFCAPRVDAQGALERQVQALQRLGGDAPYASALESTSVRVPASGAILGRCVPEIAALCWNDTDPVAAAHCRIACINGQYSVCDLVADDDGTLYDGRRLGTHWCPLKDGCNIDIGPVRMQVELRPVRAVTGNLPPEISVTNDVGCNAADQKPAPKRGTWRSAKRTANVTEVPEKRSKITAENEQISNSLQPETVCSPVCAPVSEPLNLGIPERLHSPSALFDFSPPPDSDLLRLQKQRAHCPSVGGSGRAFWAIPRDPSPEKHELEASWIPRTP
eukprot:Skav226697  [mRNA]  locus=scaffold3971:207179:208600:- [translate_table: standard]